MATAFQGIADLLGAPEVVDLILPFLLIFTIIFAVLEKSNILGKDKKNFNVIISLVVSLSVVIPHITGSYPSDFDVVEIINIFLPQIALISVMLIMMLILIGIFAPAAAAWVAIAGAIIVFLLFLGTTNFLYGVNWISDIFGEDVVSVAVMLLVFGLIIWFITGSGKGAGGKAASGIKEFVQEIFKG